MDRRRDNIQGGTERGISKKAIKYITLTNIDHEFKNIINMFHNEPFLFVLLIQDHKYRKYYFLIIIYKNG